MFAIVLDESGSMREQKEDIIGSFNQLIEDQRKIETDRVRITMVKFNRRSKIVYRGEIS